MTPAVRVRWSCTESSRSESAQNHFIVSRLKLFNCSSSAAKPGFPLLHCLQFFHKAPKVAMSIHKEPDIENKKLFQQESPDRTTSRKFFSELDCDRYVLFVRRVLTKVCLFADLYWYLPYVTVSVYQLWLQSTIEVETTIPRGFCLPLHPSRANFICLWILYYLLAVPAPPLNPITVTTSTCQPVFLNPGEMSPRQQGNDRLSPSLCIF